jgi:hypothetical protein
MRPQPILNLSKNILQETRRILLILRIRLDNLIHESGRHQLIAGNPLAHDERLVRLGDAETLDEGAAGAAFGDEAERGEGG